MKRVLSQKGLKIVILRKIFYMSGEHDILRNLHLVRGKLQIRSLSSMLILSLYFKQKKVMFSFLPFKLIYVKAIVNTCGSKQVHIDCLLYCSIMFFNIAWISFDMPAGQQGKQCNPSKIIDTND